MQILENEKGDFDVYAHDQEKGYRDFEAAALEVSEFDQEDWVVYREEIGDNAES